MKNNKLVTGLIITIGVLFALIIFLVLNHEEIGGGSIDKEFYVLYNENYRPNGEKTGIVNSEDELVSLLESLDYQNKDPYSVLPKDSFRKYDFIYYATSYDPCNEEVKFKNVVLKNSKATINFDVHLKSGICASNYVV